MPTPSKPVSILKAEGRSHRTKKEILQRTEDEKKLTSGEKLNMRPEVKKNAKAKAEFERIVNLLVKIDKNDGIYEAVINRYCIIQAETIEFEKKRDLISKLIFRIEKEFKDHIIETESKDRYKITVEFQKELTKQISLLLAIDRQIQAKRKMLLDIEDKNIMTIAGALRSIPKKTEKEKLSGGIRRAINL